MKVRKNGHTLARKSAYNSGLAPYPYVGDLMQERGVKTISRLATNETQFPPSPKVLAAMQEAIQNVNYYPDPTSTLLRRALAKHLNIKENMIIMGNGADEILHMIGKAFIEEGDNAVISLPCYPTESRGVESVGGIVKAIDYRPDFTTDIEAVYEAIDEKTKLVMLCTPGNPNTTIITHEELVWFMERVPEDILVVIDEAYGEFVDDKEAARPLEFFQEERNILFLRTFSKYYGLAGLRVGYAFGPEHIMEPFRRATPTYPVNVVAQAAAIAALDDHEHYRKVYEDVCTNRTFLTEGLLDAGFKPVLKSQTNFLFVDIAPFDYQTVVDTFFDAGIHIRGNYAAPHEQFVRMAVGRREQCEAVIEVARKLVSGK